MLVNEDEHWGLGNDLVLLKERAVEESQKLKDLFPMLLAKSTMIEARVYMDIIARLVIDGEKEEGGTGGQDKLIVLECCYGIVERCVDAHLADHG